MSLLPSCSWLHAPLPINLPSRDTPRWTADDILSTVNLLALVCTVTITCVPSLDDRGWNLVPLLKKRHHYYIRSVRLAYKSYFFCQRIIFFSYSKSVNSTFSHGLSTTFLLDADLTKYRAWCSLCFLVLTIFNILLLEGMRDIGKQSTNGTELDVWTLQMCTCTCQCHNCTHICMHVYLHPLSSRTSRVRFWQINIDRCTVTSPLHMLA